MAYSSGLSSAAEALPTARQQRDGFVKRVVVESLQSQLASATSHADALQRTAQATANVAALIVAAPYLDDFTVKRARCCTSNDHRCSAQIECCHACLYALQ